MNFNRTKIFTIAAFIISMTTYFVHKAIVYINASKSAMFWFEFKKKDTTDLFTTYYKLDPKAPCADDKGLCTHSCAACCDTCKIMDVRMCSHTCVVIPYLYKRNYILMAPYVPAEDRFSTLIIMDFDGKIIMRRKITGIVSDFRQWRVDGHIRYSYAVYDPGVFLQNYSNGSVADIVILDSALNKIKEVHLLPYKDVVTNKKQGLDHHDFIMLSDNHYITMASYVKHVSNIPASLSPSSKVKLAVPIVQEVYNDTVVWQWDASDYPEFYSLSRKWNNYSDSVNVQDYMHINGIVIDPKDSNLIISFHNTNQLVKVSRHNGNIIWRLGGKNSDFPLTTYETFYRQHAPVYIYNGYTLLLFDNGDSTARPHSRILEFELDEQQKKIAGFKAYDIPAPFAVSKGNVQLADQDYFICGGSGNYILKVNRGTGKVKTELSYNQTSFRAYMVDDIEGIPMSKNIRK